MSHFVTARAAGSRAKFALLLMAGALGTGAAGAAFSDAKAPGVDTPGVDTPGVDTPTLVVRYSNEELTSNVGVQKLYRRIQLAAKQVCPDTSVRDLRGIELARICREQAVAKAIHQVNNSQLAALYAISSKSG
ncbi:MAG: UrcA family protein [Gammaproteobacteria bacterium]